MITHHLHKVHSLCAREPTFVLLSLKTWNKCNPKQARPDKFLAHRGFVSNTHEVDESRRRRLIVAMECQLLADMHRLEFTSASSGCLWPAASDRSSIVAPFRSLLPLTQHARSEHLRFSDSNLGKQEYAFAQGDIPSCAPYCLLYTPLYQSPLILACLKYFMPTHATTTHTQAITAAKIINAG